MHDLLASLPSTMQGLREDRAAQNVRQVHVVPLLHPEGHLAGLLPVHIRDGKVSDVCRTAVEGKESAVTHTSSPPGTTESPSCWKYWDPSSTDSPFR